MDTWRTDILSEECHIEALCADSHESDTRVSFSFILGLKGVVKSVKRLSVCVWQGAGTHI